MDIGFRKLVLYGIINFKLTPHEPHYSANRLNQAIYEAIAAGDYDRFRDIATQSYVQSRQHLLRVARL
ncbi:hypothetical protein GZH47_15570 [Paenibacillus rhizovicinus]|uniref:Uncharacterized protein n=1 Tax=Paenibacillus rhizovicinus TaxID=2704463 RepID=A0A6C0P136_9BACL|nr:hypothetical protein [Paenibacillus rhizovicinus]QHW32091.1 hypothetical protein GZH47_15570 [Paenibacillus rhizovicinus]